uniref:IRS-type PTB domain-containing protein n=1 Tax=Denticeps clupeoides TaxID=299321 RepID=A0AAY4C1H9_9TELE
MDADFNDVIKQGYVMIRNRHFWTYQRCWLVLKKASSKGPCRLERFPNERAASFHSLHKVTDLTHVKNIARPPKQKRKHGLTLTFRDVTAMTLNFECETDAADWYRALYRECVQNRMKIFTCGDLQSGGPKQQCERFHVFLMPCRGLGTHGECILQIGLEAISLWDALRPHLKVASWPLRSLRRYGGDQTWFSFEYEKPVGPSDYERVRLLVRLMWSHEVSEDLISVPLASTWRAVQPPKQITITDPLPNRSCWRSRTFSTMSPESHTSQMSGPHTSIVKSVSGRLSRP